LSAEDKDSVEFGEVKKEEMEVDTKEGICKVLVNADEKKFNDHKFITAEVYDNDINFLENKQFNENEYNNEYKETYDNDNLNFNTSDILHQEFYSDQRVRGNSIENNDEYKTI